MGRRKKHQKDDLDEEIASTCSTGESSLDWVVNPKMDEENDEENLLEGFVEKLYEKRASTREAALKDLISAFSVSILDDYAEQKWGTLSYLYIASIKRGSAEAALAARALGLLIMSLGSGDAAQNLFAEAYPHLLKVAKIGTDEANRIAVVESLAILGFVSGANDDSVERVMGLLWQIGTHAGDPYCGDRLGMTKPSSELQAAAISSWAVLMSTLHFDPPSFTNLLETSLSSLSALLDTGNLDIQRAAGEAIALIFELCSSSKSIDYSSEYPIFDNDAGAYISTKAREDQLLEHMKSLSVGAWGKGHSKKEISSQRSSFRSLVASIEEGACPETRIRLRHGDMLRVDSWSRTLLLNAFRKLLATGFQIHMQYNSLLHHIFGFTPHIEKQKVLNSKEKRLFLSPNSLTSKRRTQLRKYNRSIAHAGSRGYDLSDESDVGDWL